MAAGFFAPNHFFAHIPCNPPTTTAQQHKRIFKARNGRAFLGTDSKGREVQETLISLLANNLPDASFPRDKPVSVYVKLSYAYRKSEKKSVVNAGKEVPHTSRPDIDNLLKFLLDCMTTCGFWADDSQIHDLRAVKVWSPNPGIYIEIKARNDSAKTAEKQVGTPEKARRDS